MKRALPLIASFAFVLGFVTLFAELDPFLRGGLLVLILALSWSADTLAGHMLGARLFSWERWLEIVFDCAAWYVMMAWGPYSFLIFCGIILLFAAIVAFAFVYDYFQKRSRIRAALAPRNSRNTQKRPRWEDN